MADRIEGQIWIGREEPNTLKYYARGKEYWAVSATTYTAGEAIAKGMLVAPSLTAAGSEGSEKVIKAVWPRDTDRVVGIALNTAGVNEPIRVLNYGYVKLSATELAACFTTKSDIVASAALTAGNYYTAFGNTIADGGAGNGWTDSANVWNGRGAKVYWFSGRTLKTGASTYSWKDPTSYAGKLTIATPSGYKPTGLEVPWSDESLNVSYKHLPVIGTVVSYKYDASYNLTELVLHINFSKFQQKLQFEYPAYSADSNLGNYTAGVNDPTLLTIRHGLFADYGKPHIEVSMLGYSDASAPVGSEIETSRVWPGYDSYTTGDARRTEIEIASDSPFYFKVIGEVTYCN